MTTTSSIGCQDGACKHDSDCAVHSFGVPELFGPCDCRLSQVQPATCDGGRCGMGGYCDNCQYPAAPPAPTGDKS
jgi:hypothetical protein